MHPSLYPLAFLWETSCASPAASSSHHLPPPESSTWIISSAIYTRGVSLRPFHDTKMEKSSCVSISWMSESSWTGRRADTSSPLVDERMGERPLRCLHFPQHNHRNRNERTRWDSYEHFTICLVPYCTLLRCRYRGSCRSLPP